MQQLSPVKAVAVGALPTPSAAWQGVTVRLTSDNKPYWCDGSAWVDLSLTGSGGGAAGPSLGLVTAAGLIGLSFI